MQLRVTPIVCLGRNQEKGGFDGAWCFWLRLKPEEERKPLWRAPMLAAPVVAP